MHDHEEQSHLPDAENYPLGNIWSSMYPLERDGSIRSTPMADDVACNASQYHPNVKKSPASPASDQANSIGSTRRAEPDTPPSCPWEPTAQTDPRHRLPIHLHRPQHRSHQHPFAVDDPA